MENKVELIQSAQELISKGDFQPAIEILESIKLKDDDLEVLKNLGLCFVNLEN